MHDNGKNKENLLKKLVLTAFIQCTSHAEKFVLHPQHSITFRCLIHSDAICWFMGCLVFLVVSNFHNRCVKKNG